jgi:rhodanese-related sulfurtransferase
MTNKQDKILAAVCVFLLLFSMVFFYYINDVGGEETISAALSATRTYTTAGIAANMNAETLHELIYDDNESNDPFILSIRRAEHYALGHIPGAVNIPLSSLFTEDNLAKLPKDRQIVVYCYTGHTAAQATALLNVNGYDAVCLKHGICSWTNDSSVNLGLCYNQTTHAHDYPVASGADPGVIATLAIVNLFAPQASVRTIPAEKENIKPVACGGDTEPTTVITPEPAETSDDLREATYLSLNQGKPATIAAEDLYDNLYDGDTSNDPFVLSIRKAEQYEIGHIPGAINIGISTLFTDEGLAQLPSDKNQQIVVVCYTGHSASQITALLNLNGYNATALKFGMCSWSTDENITAGICFNSSSDSHDYDVASGIWDEEMREAIYDSLNMGKPATISADSLYERITDDETENDPFILSIRRQEHYELGHIPGAINIGLTSLFSEENLAKLPINNQIVVVCYTGHTASQATALLNSLGFNATALKFGMCSWTSDSEVTVVNCYDPTVDARDYPINQGSEPGSIT